MTNENFAHTFLSQNRSRVTAFDAIRALEEFRLDYPDEVEAEQIAVAFDEPMDWQAKELYADLLTARQQNQLQGYVAKLVEFIEAGGLDIKQDEWNKKSLVAEVSVAVEISCR